MDIAIKLSTAIKSFLSLVFLCFSANIASLESIKIPNPNRKSETWHFQQCKEGCFQVNRTVDSFDHDLIKDSCFAIPYAAIVGCVGGFVINKYVKNAEDLGSGMTYGILLTTAALAMNGLIMLARMGFNWKQNGHPLYQSRFTDESITASYCNKKVSTQDSEDHSCAITSSAKECYELSNRKWSGRTSTNVSVILDADANPKLYGDIKQLTEKAFQEKQLSREELSHASILLYACLHRKTYGIREVKSFEDRLRERQYWEGVAAFRRQQNQSSC